jgi:hypothetical protein
VLLLLAEIVFVAAVAVGVGLYSLPAGIVAAGLLGILACEVASARRRRPEPAAAPLDAGRSPR